MAQDIEKTNNQMLDELFQAVDVITSKRLEELKFDKTISCQIIDDSKSQKGEYTVSDGSTQFKAYSKDTTYSKDDWVYITVLNSDFDQPKYIVGKFISEDSEHTTYIDPFDTYIDITGNLLTVDPSTKIGLVANNSKQKEIVIWKTGDLSVIPQSESGEEVNAINPVVSDTTKELAQFDRLGIRANFKSLLQDYHTTQGNYGLRLDIVTVNSGTTSTKQTHNFINFKLDSNDMFGNPYNFELWSQQKAVFDISELNDIVGMQLVFYQKDNFLNDQNQRIPLIDQSDKARWDAYLAMTNLMTQDIYISLGYDLENFTEDTLFLYNFETSTYASYIVESNKALLQEKYPDLNLNTEEDTKKALEYINRKDIHLRWIHFEGEDSIQCLDEAADLPIWENSSYEEVPLAKIHWYRYTQEDNIEDPIAGLFWKEVNLSDYEARLNAPTETDFSQWVEVPNQYNYFNWENFQPSPMTSSEKIKVIIEYPSLDFLEYSFINGFTSFLSSLPENFSTSNRNSDPGYLDAVRNELTTKFEQQYLHDLEEEAGNLEVGTPQYYEALGNVHQYMRQFLPVFNSYLAQDWQQSEYYNPYIAVWSVSEKDWATFCDNIESFHMSYLNQCVYYKSEILEFTNEHNVPDVATVELVRNLQIICDKEGLQGVYNIYHSNGQIINSMEANKFRFLTAQFGTILAGDTELNESENIKWYFPVRNTMIELPTVGCEYTGLPNFELNPIELTQEEIDGLLTEEELLLHPLQQEYLIETRSQKLIEEKEEEAIAAAKRSPKFAVFAGLIDNGERFCIERQDIHVTGERAVGDLTPTALEQIFRIKPQYSTTAINNTIRCEVYKNNKTYAAEYTMHFGIDASNNSDYTLTVTYEEYTGSEWVPMALPVLDWHGRPIRLVPHVFNYEQKEVTSSFNNNSFSYSIYSSMRNPDITTLQSGKYFVLTPGNSNDKSKYYHYIVQLKVNRTINIQATNSVSTIKLTTCCPIAVRFDDSYSFIDSDNKIVYGITGANPVYYKKQHALYKIVNNQLVKQGNIKWKIQFEDNANAYAFYPQMNYQTGEMTVPAIYIVGNTPKVSILAGVETTSGNDVSFEPVWCQPLYICQDMSTSTLLNSWDKRISIDNNNNAIISAMLGLGFKNQNNTFNGFVFGNTGPNILTDVGLFAYNQDIQSFGLKADGTTFIGRAGYGQIIFNNEVGEIRGSTFGLASAYEGYNQKGMKIDINNAYADFYGIPNEDGQAKVHIGINSGTEADSSYFSIDDSSNNSLINISDDVQYIQSSTFVQEDSSTLGSGSRFDLLNGQILGYNFLFKALTEITPQNGDPYITGVIFSSGYDEEGNTIPYAQILDTASWQNATGNQTVLELSPSSFILQSPNFREENGVFSGSKFDIKQGKITSYNFKFTGYNKRRLTNGTIETRIFNFDTDAVDTPLTVGAGNANDFSVQWDGTVTIGSGSFGGWVITPQGMFSDGVPVANQVYHGVALYSQNYTVSDLRISVDSISYNSTSYSHSWTDIDDRVNYSAVFSDQTYNYQGVGELADAGILIYKDGVFRANKPVLSNCTIVSNLHLMGNLIYNNQTFVHKYTRVVQSLNGGGTITAYKYGDLGEQPIKQDYVKGITGDLLTGYTAVNDFFYIYRYTQGRETHETLTVTPNYGVLDYLGMLPVNTGEEEGE